MSPHLKTEKGGGGAGDRAVREREPRETDRQTDRDRDRQTDIDRERES